MPRTFFNDDRLSTPRATSQPPNRKRKMMKKEVLTKELARKGSIMKAMKELATPPAKQFPCVVIKNGGEIQVFLEDSSWEEREGDGVVFLVRNHAPRKGQIVGYCFRGVSKIHLG